MYNPKVQRGSLQTVLHDAVQSRQSFLLKQRKRFLRIFFKKRGRFRRMKKKRQCVPLFPHLESSKNSPPKLPCRWRSLATLEHDLSEFGHAHGRRRTQVRVENSRRETHQRIRRRRGSKTTLGLHYHCSQPFRISSR